MQWLSSVGVPACVPLRPVAYSDTHARRCMLLSLRFISYSDAHARRLMLLSLHNQPPQLFRRGYRKFTGEIVAEICRRHAVNY